MGASYHSHLLLLFSSLLSLYCSVLLLFTVPEKLMLSFTWTNQLTHNGASCETKLLFSNRYFRNIIVKLFHSIHAI
ncbi:hypothetical protein OIU74_024508 [Salix koriyanagi]|uniref:Uncharacterized protein n=1 Tax=Salix koriyanagi TaxID=2511006 RepID=A0A9Q0WA64_9ROSI|nr:hypothetical protein OIU74_024508 [Salix koriyanagi]